jgi:hypothetical protein
MRYLPFEIPRDTQSGPQLTQVELVRIALSSRLMGAYLQRAFGQISARRDKLPACRILDMKYEPGEYCTLLYQLGDQTVVGHLRWSDGIPVSPSSADRIEPLAMELYPYPKDPWLPGLEKAIDPRLISAALTQELPECQSGDAGILRVE